MALLFANFRIPREAGVLQLCLLVTLSLGAWAQTAPPPDRIIDEEAAARAKRGTVGQKILAVPMYPLRAIGRGMEKGLVAVEERGWDKSVSGLHTPDTSTRRQGIAPLFGGFDIGAGWAGGAKYYRNDFPFRGMKLEVPLRVSTNRYRELSVNFIARPQSSFPVEFGASYRGRPMEDFFGLGPFSNERERSDYDLQERSLFVRPVWRMTPTFSAISHARFSNTSIYDGQDNLFPGTRRRFGGAGIPGIGGARMFAAGLMLLHDNRPTQGMPWTGGLEAAGVSIHEGLGNADFGYWKYRVELMRFLPLASKRRVLALHLLGETNSPRGGSQVPFFDQVILGGGPTMRGFREFRFYDHTGVLATAEYRFNLNAWSAGFLFVDEGQVARRPGDVTWRGFRTSYGAGIRFFTGKSAIFNFSVGKSAEGLRVYLVFAPRF